MECKEKCFTFLWKLENISYCFHKEGERIESPAFVLDTVEKIKWRLRLYLKGCKDGNIISYFLSTDADTHCEGADAEQIKYDLEFVSKDGTILSSLLIGNQYLEKGGGFGSRIFPREKDAIVSTKSEFLPEDTLRVRCRIWKVDGKMNDDVRCIAYTRIGVEKRSFEWNVVNFSTLELEKIYTYEIKSINNDIPVMSIELSVTGVACFEEVIYFELYLQDKSIKFGDFQLFLIDASGNKVECNQDQFRFDGLVKSKHFIFFFSKKKLITRKRIYLPGDVLSLHWEWTFFRGVVLEEIEEVRQGTTCSKSQIPDVQAINNEIQLPMSYSLWDNLQSLYDQQFLCDVKLKTSTSTFPAHKIILSASSPVFNAMFSNDMKEKESDCVNIEDLTDDAVRRLLLYIYTSRMDNVTWESASHLYAAADKYAILSLKIICSSYLKENLSPSNACELLLLADLHADGDLKCSIQNYILKDDKSIINSDEWKLLMETNSKLAAETLCLRHK